jgi:farnesyl-diphosphate farnesyltransferase
MWRKASMLGSDATAPGALPTPAQMSHLESQMNAVSRSFAVVVAYLEQPLRVQLSTAYLLCRVADNIEDCTEDSAWKSVRFDEFDGMLFEPQAAPDVLGSWDEYPWPGLTTDERKLMGQAGGAELWRIYASITAPERATIRRWVQAMTEGMKHLEDPSRVPNFVERRGVKVLDGRDDYNYYCYIVAGTVGHMATELVTHRYSINGATGSRLLDASEACGRALQKTNILKDFAEDLERGVCYLPDEWLRMSDHAPLALGGASGEFKRAVLDDILSELEVATQYVIDLPLEARDYRMASLLCLLPALQTNLLAAREQQKLFTAEHRYKISRSILGQCLMDARGMIGDNSRIRSYSSELQQEIRRTLNQDRKTM